MTRYAANVARNLYAEGITRPEAVEAVIATLIRDHDLTEDEAPSFYGLAYYGQS